jgi:hypothetical protein
MFFSAQEQTCMNLSVSSLKATPASRVNLLAAVALVTLVAATAVIVGYAVRRAVTPPVTVISEQALAEQFGLHINVLALTAANGMVDLRLQVVDADKAASLLRDPANAPALVSAGGVTLSAAKEAHNLEELMKKDDMLYFMYGNAGNAVQSGAPVTVKFGATRLEPVTVQ